MSRRRARSNSNLRPLTSGIVYLVGAGPGDPGLITVAGLERLREADVIVYDRLVSPRLLEQAAERAEIIFMGKVPSVILSGKDVRAKKTALSRRNLGRGLGDATTHEHGPHDQSRINELLIEKARAGKRVVRLKGGDPFVFGRGGEEAQALRAAAVPFEVVPGVSSAIAVPAYAGIPVTHRGLASSFAVITGHEADPDILSGDDAHSRQTESSRRNLGGVAGSGGSGRSESSASSAIDWAKLATAVDTLVFLMGAKTLPDIVDKLVENGRPADTPAAVIQWGTTPEQRTVTGTLADIVARVDEAGLSAPTIAVVGEVVRLRDTLAWFEGRPLFGKRVLITRTRRQASALARLLALEGALPVELPAIEIEPAADAAAVEAALSGLRAGAYTWAVFTSANGVDAFFRLLGERGLDARAFAAARVAAIGPATAEALAEHGIIADAVPDEYIAEGVLAALAGSSSVILSDDHGLSREEAASRRNLGRGSGRSRNEIETAREPHLRPGDRVLLPRAESARPELVEGLRSLGAEVDELVLYRAAVPAAAPAEALSLLREGAIDIVTFTSSSTVRNLAALLDGDVECLRNAVIACIGPVTARTAEELGLRVDVVASEHTVPGLVRALRKVTG